MSDHVSIDPIRQALAAPFPKGSVKWKPQAVSGTRALAIAYVDARTVMDRLDDVLGLGNWQTSYREVKGGIMCSLRIRIGEEWITHEDVGGESDQPDEGDQQKAAVSDALKRAAVHIGVGRYLYRIKALWVDYDQRTRQLRNLPVLADDNQSVTQPVPQAPAADVQTYVRDWNEWLATRPDREAVNEVLRDDFARLPVAAKRPIWERICTYAEERGWAFDRELKQFVEAREPAEETGALQV